MHKWISLSNNKGYVKLFHGQKQGFFKSFHCQKQRLFHCQFFSLSNYFTAKKTRVFQIISLKKQGYFTVNWFHRQITKLISLPNYFTAETRVLQINSVPNVSVKFFYCQKQCLFHTVIFFTVKFCQCQIISLSINKGYFTA
jgi:hypothetical protein